VEQYADAASIERIDQLAGWGVKCTRLALKANR
jgi:hypothetical protein